MGVVSEGLMRTICRAVLALGGTVLPGLAAAQPAPFMGQHNAFGVPDAPQQGAPQQGNPAPSGFLTQPFYPPAYNPQPPPFEPAPPQYGQAPQQAPPQQAPPLSIQQYLAGLWHGTTNDASGSWDIYATFQPNGTFVQQQSQQQPQGVFRLALMGRYDAQVGPDGGVLTLYPQAWDPRQICQGPGNCHPVNLPPSIAVRFRPMSRDMLQTTDGAFQRIGPAQ